MSRACGQPALGVSHRCLADTLHCELSRLLNVSRDYACRACTKANYYYYYYYYYYFDYTDSIVILQLVSRV